MDKPLVSIIIPVYNGENYLREAIDSALAQTYDNIEIIVVNDGSTDGTEDVCLSYGDKIRYFKKENGGVATALNYGIEKMLGEYFSWLSHDDLYYPNKIKCQIDALNKCGDKKRIVFGDVVSWDLETGKKRELVFGTERRAKYINNSIFPVVRYMLLGCALLIHKSHFERVGLFNTNLKCVQDYDMWFRMFRDQESLYVNEFMYIQRIHNAQGTWTMKNVANNEDVWLWKHYALAVSDDEMRMIYGSKLLYLFEILLRLERAGEDDSELHNEITELAKKYRDRLIKGLNFQNRAICIFGSGIQGNRLYRLLKFLEAKVDCFADNNSSLWGKAIAENVACVPPVELRSKQPIVIIAIEKYDAEVKKQLIELGVRYIFKHRDIDRMLSDDDDN